MTDIIIENIIASTNIEPIDLEQLHTDLENSQINYEVDEEENTIPLSVLWENPNGIALVLFNDGRLVSVQATTLENATSSIEDFIRLLEEMIIL